VLICRECLLLLDRNYRFTADEPLRLRRLIPRFALENFKRFPPHVSMGLVSVARHVQIPSPSTNRISAGSIFLGIGFCESLAAARRKDHWTFAWQSAPCAREANTRAALGWRAPLIKSGHRLLSSIKHFKIDIFFFIFDKLRAARPSGLRSVRCFRGANPEISTYMLTTSEELLTEPGAVVAVGAGAVLFSVTVSFARRKRSPMIM